MKTLQNNSASVIKTKNIGVISFLLDNSATVHFWKNFPVGPPPGYSGFNDTGLEVDPFKVKAKIYKR
jgi:hypothetical protein